MSFLHNIFRTPRYLSTPVFGLDISENSLKYIQLVSSKNMYRLGDFGSVDIPTGVVRGGALIKPEELTKLLKKTFISKKISHIALALPEEEAFVQIINLPAIAEEEVEEAASLQLEEHIPLPPEEISFAYHVLPSESKKTLSVLITAFPMTILETYKTAVENADLSLVSMEIESQAIARAVVPHAEISGTTLIVDIGLGRTGFIIAKDGFTQFTSTIPIGGSHINQALMNDLNINEQKAEEIKTTKGLSRNPEDRRIFEATIIPIQSIKEELKKRVEYWQSSIIRRGKDEGKIDHIYLCGGTANMPNLTRYFSMELRQSVSLANVWANITDTSIQIPEIEFQDSLSYATSLGAALGATKE